MLFNAFGEKVYYSGLEFLIIYVRLFVIKTLLLIFAVQVCSSFSITTGLYHQAVGNHSHDLLWWS